MYQILYKRNAQGKPIFWSVQYCVDKIRINYGLVGNTGRIEYITTHRKLEDEINSLIKAKRKEGYKSLPDLYDNAPVYLENQTLLLYLDTYLPKNNTHNDGAFIPMLCKTLQDNKPFEKNEYFGQWKINGERCIITAKKLENSLFESCKLYYRSREGIDWTDKLSYLDDYILPCIPNDLLDMMLEEGVGLDGELYLPGYGINEINSFVKNTELPQHYKLQFWCYDICIENMSAIKRQEYLDKEIGKYKIHIFDKDTHLNTKSVFNYLPFEWVSDFNDAVLARNNYITLGFEGLVIRDSKAEYQFGGKRNNSMLKFKKKEDGKFVIIDIIPEGIKRSHLPKFVCKNDINNELFECTINKSHKEQEEILINKNKYIGKLMLVEFRERSGVNKLPFHAKGINIINN